MGKIYSVIIYDGKENVNMDIFDKMEPYRIAERLAYEADRRDARSASGAEKQLWTAGCFTSRNMMSSTAWTALTQ